MGQPSLPLVLFGVSSLLAAALGAVWLPETADPRNRAGQTIAGDNKLARRS